MNLFRMKRIKKHGIMLDKSSDGNEVCFDCDADCCRGFPSVKLTPAEYSALERLGATRLQFLLNGDHYLIIEHGCEFLKDNRCGIYNQRPSVCRHFSCSEI